MASKYQNMYAALDSDDEDTPRVSKKVTPPPSAPVALNNPAAGNKKAANKKAPVGDKKETRGPREGGRGTRERGERSEGGRGPRERGERSEGGRGPRERGERSERGRGNRGPRRDFERRSGTGRGKETSRQGGGAHNWGNKADPTEQLAEADLQEGAKLVSDEESPEELPVEEQEEEEVQLTLDEYLEKKKSSRSGELFAEVEVRQVSNEFSSAVQITKEGKTPDFMDSQYEKVYSKKTSGRKKQVITDVGFRTEKPERFTREFDSSRGGRGGRGARGNGRSGGRGGRSANVPNVTDMSAFPSLG
ncbi:Predicted RNA-binding protein [Plasmopara halstedii]|uniref:Predicted RNA-binding protein n=1 Tax=Plasmopara halstedii TaxID=4781 RepID=A0A0N7L7U7_PLAHL|nr:Predicted RNA-binding protein [Plasmopara halstedii]CEG48067.1 Predicted RNA-binding protein [Plasmopara halstedii]|eukprot:XP_024584436.1 Predicted RNA-binding protein [Plasmopara halstedii]